MLMYFLYKLHSIQITHTGTEEITTGWIRHPLALLVSQMSTKIPIISWLPLAHTLSWRPQCFLRSPEIRVNAEPVADRSQKVWLFPQCSVAHVKLNRSLYGRNRQRLKIIFSGILWMSFLRETWPFTSFKGFWL